MIQFLTIDPGKSSGLVLASYSGGQAWTRQAYAQVEGSLEGLLHWFSLTDWEWRYIVCERFTLLSKEFVPNIEPVRIEGYLQGQGVLGFDYSASEWQRPAEMYFCGGETKREKLKLSRAWLKERGLLVTGKQVGCKDANDVVSATLHSIQHMRKQKHIPTMKALFGGEE